MLPPGSLNMEYSRDLCYCIGVVGRLEMPGEQVFLLDRLRCQFR